VEFDFSAKVIRFSVRLKLRLLLGLISFPAAIKGPEYMSAMADILRSLH